MNPFKVGDFVVFEEVDGVFFTRDTTEKVQYIGEVIGSHTVGRDDHRVRIKFTDGYETGHLKIRRVRKLSEEV